RCSEIRRRVVVMSRHVQYAIVVALMCSTASLAQDRPPAASSASSGTLIVVGCVHANPDEPAQGFVLTDATTDFSSGLKSDERTDETTRYLLVGDENDLVKLEGQRVKVSGKIAPSTKPEDQPVATSGSGQVKPETLRLKVSEIEVVAGKCSTR